MLETIAQESENIENLITEETETRGNRMETLTYDLKHEGKSQNNFVRGFYKGSFDEFCFTIKNITAEMNNRFDH